MNNEHMTKASNPADDAASTVGNLASDFRSAASQKYEEAKKQAQSMAEDTKSDVADEVKDVASALRRASEELRSGSAQERTLGQIADMIADASDSIRDKDLGEILAMVSRKGRENPVLFLGGAALLGFAASRYAKASGGHAASPDAPDRKRQRAQINDFVGEGNPNTQPLVAMP